jgi:hypothetical protein
MKMARLKKIRRVVTRELELYQCRLANCGDEQQASTFGHHAPHRALRQTTFLCNEMEELNSWARLAFQVYFGWFALQFTVNGVAMGWIFTYKGPAARFGALVLVIFIGWNLMGAIGTLLVHKGLLDCDLRIGELVEMLTEQDRESRSSLPRSPMPRRAINTVFAFCAVTMFMSLVFWIILFITQDY